MKRQDVVKYHSQTPAELKAEVSKRQDQLVEAHLQLRLGKLKNVHTPSRIKKEIAQLLTIIKSQELAKETV